MPMPIYGYIASVFMGLTLGMMGGGGSILTVPILVYFFSKDPVVSTSTSLFIVGMTALIGGILSMLRNEVDIKTGITFAVPSFIAVYLTKTILVPKIPDNIWSFGDFSLTKSLLIMILFASLMVLASLSMLRKKTNSSRALKTISGQGFLVGIVTGFVGAGGGFLIVPALVNLVGLNIRKAVGTSLMIIAANSLFGFSVSLIGGLKVDWRLLLSILSMAIIGLIVGAMLSRKVPENKLKKAFGFFVLIMGTLILGDQLLRLAF